MRYRWRCRLDYVFNESIDVLQETGVGVMNKSVTSVALYATVESGCDRSLVLSHRILLIQLSMDHADQETMYRQ